MYIRKKILGFDINFSCNIKRVVTITIPVPDGAYDIGIGDGHSYDDGVLRNGWTDFNDYKLFYWISGNRAHPDDNRPHTVDLPKGKRGVLINYYDLNGSSNFNKPKNRIAIIDLYNL